VIALQRSERDIKVRGGNQTCTEKLLVLSESIEEMEELEFLLLFLN
jgi:hypothetical protein